MPKLSYDLKFVGGDLDDPNKFNTKSIYAFYFTEVWGLGFGVN